MAGRPGEAECIAAEISVLRAFGILLATLEQTIMIGKKLLVAGGLMLISPTGNLLPRRSPVPPPGCVCVLLDLFDYAAKQNALSEAPERILIKAGRSCSIVRG